MKKLLALIHAFLMTSTFALACYTFITKYPNANKFDIAFQVPEWVYIITFFGVIGVSSFWAIGHTVSGGLMGLASGGMFEGMRLGLLLGLGFGLGRMWPYAALWATGAVIFSANLWEVVGYILFAIFCVVCNVVVTFFWQRVRA